MPEIIKDIPFHSLEIVKRHSYIKEINKERIDNFSPKIKNEGALNNEVVIIATSISHTNPKLSTMRWGNNGKIPLEINTTDETYQSFIVKQRCLIFTDGFYVNRLENIGRTPYYVQSILEKPLVFAGVWMSIKSDDGNVISGCSVLTTEIGQNSKMGYLNNSTFECPVILNEQEESAWVDYTLDIGNLLKRDFDEMIQAHTISPAINLKVSDPYNTALVNHIAYSEKPII